MVLQEADVKAGLIGKEIYQVNAYACGKESEGRREGRKERWKVGWWKCPRLLRSLEPAEESCVSQEQVCFRPALSPWLGLDLQEQHPENQPIVLPTVRDLQGALSWHHWKVLLPYTSYRGEASLRGNNLLQNTQLRRSRAGI